MKPPKKRRRPSPSSASADWRDEMRAMLDRLQDPAYVMQVIRRCQEEGLIPKDKPAKD